MVLKLCLVRVLQHFLTFFCCGFDSVDGSCSRPRFLDLSVSHRVVRCLDTFIFLVQLPGFRTVFKAGEEVLRLSIALLLTSFCDVDRRSGSVILVKIHLENKDSA